MCGGRFKAETLSDSTRHTGAMCVLLKHTPHIRVQSQELAPVTHPLKLNAELHSFGYIRSALVLVCCYVLFVMLCPFIMQMYLVSASKLIKL